jgi:hypothetical protein
MPLSDLENEYDDDYSNIIATTNKNEKNLISNSKNILTNNDDQTSQFDRCKSAFKQSFDYEINLENSADMKMHQQQNITSKKTKNIFGKIEREESDVGSRLATGDTGYDSLSSGSMSSYISINNNEHIKTDENLNKYYSNNKHNAYDLEPVLIHKPKIFASTISPTTSSVIETTQSLLNNKNSSIKIKNDRNNLSLKNLKTHLKPLPGIKAPK